MTPRYTASRPRATLTALARSLVTALLGYTILVFFYQHLQSLAFPYPLDYGEGPLLDISVRMSRLEPIYFPSFHSNSSYLIVPYPPIFMALQVPFVWLFGPAFWYGRLISAVSAIVTAACIGLTVYRLTRDMFAAFVSGSLLLAIPFVSYWSQFNRVDTLALGFSWLGLYAIVRNPENRRSIISGTVLLVAAIFTRQSEMLAAPLAAFVFLWNAEGRKTAITLAVLIAVMTAIVSGVLILATGGGFWTNIISANIGNMSVSRLLAFSEQTALVMPVMLVLGILLASMAIAKRRKEWAFVATYLAAAAIGSLTIAKDGSSVNYLFELSAALCLATGTIVYWSRGKSLPAAGVMVALFAQSAIFVVFVVSFFATQIEPRIALRAEMDQLFAIVQHTKGPVLADEFSGLLPLAGKPIVYQPFEAQQAADEGLIDLSPVRWSIRRASYSLILVYGLGDNRSADIVRERWTEGEIQAMDESYSVKEVLAGTTVLQPKW